MNPVWPLPRRPDGPSDEEIRSVFAKHDTLLYPYSFEGRLVFSEAHQNLGKRIAGDPDYFAKRFRHFMPFLVDAQGGSLKGKRVLDIACSSGYWAIQCALLGAEVVAFEARPEQIELAKYVQKVVGLDNIQFEVLDFWEMAPEKLGGTFDVVLNLGIFYHLSKPIEALERTMAMSHKHVLLDTAVYPANGPLIKLQWDDSEDIRMAVQTGIAALSSKEAIELMFAHVKAGDWFEIPLTSKDAPARYLNHEQASWLITV
jgi:SAM-dependent methyltransferase